MEKFIDILCDIFTKLIQYGPDKYNELRELIKETLNTKFADKNIKCDKVFFSNSSGSNPFNCIVIPTRKKKILQQTFFDTYDIDIDISCLGINSNVDKNHLSPIEMTAWLMHELAANIMTDETLCRFKKLLIEYYDTDNTAVLDTIDIYNQLLWIGVFDNTKKSYSDNESEVNTILDNYDLSEIWDMALTKYVSTHGGNLNIISDNYLHQKDKVCLKEFNKLARKYSSYALKYNNTDYSTMVKYVSAITKSELLKYYVEHEPEHVAIVMEKDVYNLFDDSKLLYESANDNTNNELYSEYIDIKNSFNSIQSMSDKLYYSVRLKDLMKKVDARYINDSSNEFLQTLKLNIDSLINQVKDIDIDHEISTLELE